jgi:hypothetical protein
MANTFSQILERMPSPPNSELPADNAVASKAQGHSGDPIHDDFPRGAKEKGQKNLALFYLLS